MIQAKEKGMNRRKKNMKMGKISRRKSSLENILSFTLKDHTTNMKKLLIKQKYNRIMWHKRKGEHQKIYKKEL